MATITGVLLARPFAIYNDISERLHTIYMPTLRCCFATQKGGLHGLRSANTILYSNAVFNIADDHWSPLQTDQSAMFYAQDDKRRLHPQYHSYFSSTGSENRSISRGSPFSSSIDVPCLFTVIFTTLPLNAKRNEYSSQHSGINGARYNWPFFILMPPKPWIILIHVPAIDVM